MNAQQNESTAADVQAIFDRIEKYATTHTTATEYYIEGEGDAALVLIALAAVIEQTIDSIRDEPSKAKRMQIAIDYKKAVEAGNALSYLSAMTEENQLHVHGLALVPRSIIIQ